MKSDTYRDGKRPGRKGYQIDDNELVRLFNSGITFKEIGKILNISHRTVIDHLGKFGLGRNKRHTIKRHDSFSTFTQESCYWAGFIAADGYIRNGVGIELSAIDINHLIKLCRFVGREEDLYFRTRCIDDKVRKYVSLHLRSKQIADDLEKLFNIVPRKSLILEPPNLPKEMLRHFIRGYFDGDGSVGWHKYNNIPRICFCSGSEKFITWIFDILHEELEDLGNRTVKKRKNSKVKTLSFSGKSAQVILDWMYGGDNITYLDRKFNKFTEYKDRFEGKHNSRKNKREAVLSEMIDLYDKGFSYRDIAKELNTTEERVSYYLKHTNIPKKLDKRDGLFGKRLSERNKKIIEAYLAGEKPEEIAVNFGMSKANFWIIVRGARESIT